MAGPILGRPLPPQPPMVRVIGVLNTAEVPVLSAAPATDVALAEVASVLATNVAVTQAGLATVASTAAANSALLLTATNTVASTAAANSALLLTATNTVASVAATTAAASDAILVDIRDAVETPPPVAVSNFPAVQAVSPVQNSGKTVYRYVLAQGSTPGTAIVAAASPGNKHKVVGVLLTVRNATTLQFTGTANLTGIMSLPKDGMLNIPPNPTFPFVETTANAALSVVTTGDGANGVILYLTEP